MQGTWALMSLSGLTRSITPSIPIHIGAIQEPTVPNQTQSIRILLVEDEAMIAMLVEDMLADFGGELVATAARLDDAVTQASDREFDVAILDLNLAGTFTYPVADILRRRGIPFVFATGYGTSGLASGYENEVMLQKPFVADELESVIRKILS